MRKALIPILALLGLAIGSAALAEVIAEGKAVNGYYWQKVQKSNGSIQYLCRSTASGKIQKSASCENAGAIKP